LPPFSHDGLVKASVILFCFHVCCFLLS